MRLDQFIQARVIGTSCRWVPVEPFTFQSLESMLGRRRCGIGGQRVEGRRVSLDGGSHFNVVPREDRTGLSAQEWLNTGCIAENQLTLTIVLTDAPKLLVRAGSFASEITNPAAVLCRRPSEISVADFQLMLSVAANKW